MSETLMDTNPLPPTVPQSDKLAAPDASSAARSEPVLAEKRRESAFSPLIQVFVGPDGFYAGTRWLIYIAMAFLVFAIFSTVLNAVYPHRSGSVGWIMVRELGMMLSAIVPGFVMARIEGRPFGDFGLPARGAFGRNFWAGALWGIASLSVLMLALRALGVFSFGSLDLHGARVAEFAFFYAVFFLITGLFEDFLMRGYSQWVLSRAMNFWPAAALLSVIFGAIHAYNPGEARIGLVAVIAIGFFFCLTLRRTGTLWWAVGFHMSWDWGESYLYSVPDSGAIAHGHLLNSSLNGPAWLTGGSVGPEGSYLIFVLMAALWILFDRVYPEVKYGG
jgi:membrane protease YdiL (CAAX protease family)